MLESRPSEPDRGKLQMAGRDYSTPWVAMGILAIAVGAGLFHPGAGLILAGVAMIGVGLFGAPRTA